MMPEHNDIQWITPSEITNYNFCPAYAEILKENTNDMGNEKIYNMAFAKVFPLLIAKAEKKGRTLAEVLEVTSWLTGYTSDAIESALITDLTYGDFFRNAPILNPNRTLITGVVCGVRVENVEEPLMREIRYLDKLVDELAKGKPMEKILRG